MIKRSTILLILLPVLFWAQQINNSLTGYYQQKGDTSFYPYFSFDGNGKVDISGYGTEDFFVKNDSVFIFTDKTDVFIFKLKGNQLTGLATGYVKGERWQKKDSAVTNNRRDDAAAQRKAVLLNEYYLRTAKNRDFTMLFDEDANHKYADTLNDLCGKGLMKACKEFFALRLMNLSGGVSQLLSGKKTSITKNPELEGLAQKIIQSGDADGYLLMGSYLQATGKEQEAREQFEKAAEEGSTKAALLLWQMEIAEEESEL